MIHFLRKSAQLGELVKFSHSVFALPFALAAGWVASEGHPSPKILFLIVLAMVTARNAGMAFNRYLDAELDARNPRTTTRPIPQKVFSKRFVLSFSVLNAILFIIIAGRINPLCFFLSFPTVALLYFYSFTKRFTSLSHLVLGLILGISPIAAWIAVTGEIKFAPVLLGAAVLLWVAGFDVIYATQDDAFDRKESLHSLVVRLGIPQALKLSRLFHVITLGLLLLFGSLLHLGGIYYFSILLISFLFIYEHSLVHPSDLSRVNAAFFKVNGFISILFLCGVILS